MTLIGIIAIIIFAVLWDKYHTKKATDQLTQIYLAGMEAKRENQKSVSDSPYGRN